jgi:hypothetical protein
VHPLLPAVQQAYVGLSEIELRELTRHALEAHHERRGQLLHLDSVESVEGALA